MTESGMIRKLDDLGRIVIPKEIRATLNLIEGMPLKIYISENNELVLKPFSYVKAFDKYACVFSESIAKILNKSVLITDERLVICASSELKKTYNEKKISIDLVRVFERQQSYLYDSSQKTTKLQLIENDDNDYCSQLIVPIICNDKTIGLLILFSQKEGMDKTCLLCAEVLSKIYSGILSDL